MSQVAPSGGRRGQQTCGRRRQLASLRSAVGAVSTEGSVPRRTTYRCGERGPSVFLERPSPVREPRSFKSLATVRLAKGESSLIHFPKRRRSWDPRNRRDRLAARPYRKKLGRPVPACRALSARVCSARCPALNGSDWPSFVRPVNCSFARREARDGRISGRFPLYEAARFPRDTSFLLLLTLREGVKRVASPVEREPARGGGCKG